MTFVFLLFLAFGSFFALALRNFRAALTLLFALLPSYLIRFSLVQIPTTALEMFILILALVWMLRRPNPRAVFDALKPLRTPLLLLLAASCFAVIASSNTFGALGAWKAYFVEPALVFLMLRTTFAERRDWERALLALGASVAVIAFFAIFQVATGLGIPAAWELSRRATSLFDFPNAVGLFVAPVVTALIVWLVCAGRQNVTAVTNRLPLVFIILGLVAIVLAQTEAAYVAIPIALFVAFLFSRVATKRKLLVTGILAALIVVLFAGSTTVRQKLLLEDASGLVRRSQWRETVTMLFDRPLTGAGLENYPQTVAPYHDFSLYEIFQYPHNILLNIWSELGLFGVFAFFVLGSVIFRFTWKYRDNPFVLASFVALLTMTIHGLVDVPYFKNDLSVMTWFFLAMFAWASQYPAEPMSGVGVLASLRSD